MIIVIIIIIIIIIIIPEARYAKPLALAGCVRVANVCV